MVARDRDVLDALDGAPPDRGHHAHAAVVVGDVERRAIDPVVVGTRLRNLVARNFLRVLQVGEVPDSVFITGLKNGELLVLEELEKVDPKKKYIGIKR